MMILAALRATPREPASLFGTAYRVNKQVPAKHRFGLRCRKLRQFRVVLRIGFEIRAGFGLLDLDCTLPCPACPLSDRNLVPKLRTETRKKETLNELHPAQNRSWEPSFFIGLLHRLDQPSPPQRAVAQTPKLNIQKLLQLGTPKTTGPRNACHRDSSWDSKST